MKKILTAIFSAVCLCAAISCSSNNEIDIFCTLYGTITDVETGTPLENASITLAPGSKTAVSGPDGTYQFEKLEERQYTITVQKAGYTHNFKTVKAVAGEKTKADIPLSKEK